MRWKDHSIRIFTKMRKRFEDRYSKMIESLHKDKIYTSHLRFNSKKFVWVPVAKDVAMKGMQVILRDGRWKLRRKVQFEIDTGVHISCVLPKEQLGLDKEQLKSAELKWSKCGGKVKFKIVGITLYHKREKTYVALKIVSKFITEIREEIGLMAHPEEFNMHVTMAENK